MCVCACSRVYLCDCMFVCVCVCVTEALHLIKTIACVDVDYYQFFCCWMLLSWKLFYIQRHNEFCHQLFFALVCLFFASHAIKFYNNGTKRRMVKTVCVPKKTIDFQLLCSKLNELKNLMTHSIKNIFNGNAKFRWISINVIYYNHNYNDIVRVREEERNSVKSCVLMFKLMTSTWCLVTSHSN